VIKNAVLEDYYSSLFFECIGLYTTRHPGRDCRDPEAMDGNIQSGAQICIGNYAVRNRSHPCALDSGNPCRNDDVTQSQYLLSDRLP
jgi:hypothetical protein